MTELGEVIEDVPGLEGNLNLEIPEGTQTGEVLRIMDNGVPHLDDSGRGDEYVIVKVATPTGLNDREKELLRGFEESRRQHPAGQIDQRG